MIRVVFQNFGWKLLSLAAAIAVWLNVASDPELATIVSVPVVYSNYPRDLVISSEITGLISVEATGPGRQIRSLPDSHSAAVLDLSSVTGPGERTFTLTAAELSLPRGVTLVRAVPGQLRITFERKATRTLRVEVPFSGSLADGLAIEEESVTPQEMTVTGPSSRVTQASGLVADPFDLSRVRGDMEQMLAVYADDPELRISGIPRVRVRVKVRQGR